MAIANLGCVATLGRFFIRSSSELILSALVSSKVSESRSQVPSMCGMLVSTCACAGIYASF